MELIKSVEHNQLINTCPLKYFKRIRFLKVSRWIMNILANPLKSNEKVGVLKKKAFLKILQNSQENTCARVSFLKNLLT